MRKVLFIFSLFFVSLTLNAQISFDGGIFMGMTQVHSDQYWILPIADSTYPGNFVGGVYFRYGWNSRYSWRAGFNAGPDMAEAFGLVEYNFLPLNPKIKTQKFTPYIASGFSYLVDFPTYKLVYSTTAPQDVIDKRFGYWVRNIRIPFNLGLRYNITPRITLGVEWALRKGYQLDYTQAPPVFSPIPSNWRSHVGVTLGFGVSNYCPTCPFYDNQRSKRR